MESISSDWAPTLSLCSEPFFYLFRKLSGRNVVATSSGGERDWKCLWCAYPACMCTPADCPCASSLAVVVPGLSAQFACRIPEKVRVVVVIIIRPQGQSSSLFLLRASADGKACASQKASPFTSTVALASVSVFTVGTIAWYTHLYGTLPFIGTVSANSPAEDGLHPPQYPWGHKGWFNTFDHARCVQLVLVFLDPELTFLSRYLSFPAFDAATWSTRKFARRAIPLTGLPGVTWSVSLIPPQRLGCSLKRSSTPTAPTIKAKCSQDPESSPTICPPLILTKKPLVQATAVRFPLTFP